MQDLVQLFLLALLGSVIGLIGGIIFLFSRRTSSFLQKHSIPFAAGVLLTVSLLVLIPEAFEEIGETAFLVMLLSFFAAFLFEYFIIDIHHHDHTEHKKVHGNREFGFSGALVIVGDTIHNFIDGIAIATSFFVDPALGLVVAASTLFHEIPHEIGDFAVLLKAGYSRRSVFLINLGSSLLTIVGAFFALLFIDNDQFIGIMLAISAGIFLYLGTIDFLPNIREGYKNKYHAIVPLVLGILIMIFTVMLIPHPHPEIEDTTTEKHLDQ